MPPRHPEHARTQGAPVDRYHRQRLLPSIGDAGQERLAEARVLVAGCGALGCGIIDALARAGVGRLVLVDRDIVETTNLQRQSLYTERDAEQGVPKAVAAAERVAAINSRVAAEPVVADLSAANAARLGRGCDLILDGLDNFEARYILNDLAVREGLPYIYGGAVATTGMSLAILPRPEWDAPERAPGGHLRWSAAQATPCLRCLFPSAPPPGASPTCDTAGVLGPMVTIIAAFQATQAIKLLVGAIDAVDRRLLSVELWENEWRFLDASAAGPAPECPCCAARRFEFLEPRRDEGGSRSGGASTLCGRDAVQVSPAEDARRIDLEAIASRLVGHGSFDVRPHLLRGVLTAERGDAGEVELTLFRDGRAILKGVRDPARGRAIYAKYIGM
ncbi:MAG TPA: ThiF family adenylyltransferase [Phycisphaerales bacterium]|nr:ThiF family adenylyltransferase [Phycisphaerales bacterium]HMP37354.1 ThiF family adenylyltransferase [Phycisphaerales bacterium]